MASFYSTGCEFAVCAEVKMMLFPMLPRPISIETSQNHSLIVILNLNLHTPMVVNSDLEPVAAEFMLNHVAHALFFLVAKVKVSTGTATVMAMSVQVHFLQTANANELLEDRVRIIVTWAPAELQGTDVWILGLAIVLSDDRRRISHGLEVLFTILMTAAAAVVLEGECSRAVVYQEIVLLVVQLGDLVKGLLSDVLQESSETKLDERDIIVTVDPKLRVVVPDEANSLVRREKDASDNS
jgi:hypothetical protein